ncbi:MAG TPA: ABC transporter permease subunit [Actinocrinis sp.]|nr:ABC transporter permease subunit [Actinocrinis sp.]
MSAQAGTAAHRAVPLEARLAATTRSEWIKFRSVRSGPLILLATVEILLLGAWLLGAGFRGGWATMSAADKAAFDPVYTSLEAILLAQLFVGALGVMTVTGEYTSGLIRGTFLATPQRAQVLAIKALVFTAVVWACCAVLAFAAFFLGQSQLSGPAKHVGIGDPGVFTAVFGAGLYLVFVGLLGVFIGVLVRRTPAALTALFGLIVVLPFAVGLLPGTLGERLGEYLPSNAGEEGWRLLHGGAYTLGPWTGLGVFAAYVAAAGAAAFALIRRRDA